MLYEVITTALELTSIGTTDEQKQMRGVLRLDTAQLHASAHARARLERDGGILKQPPARGQYKGKSLVEYAIDLRNNFV